MTPKLTALMLALFATSGVFAQEQAPTYHFNKPVRTLTVVPMTHLAQLSAASLTFTGVDVGASATQTVALLNVGNSTLSLGTIGVNGSGVPFSSSTTCGATLAPNASCTISVSFSPVSPEPASATLSVSGNFTNGPLGVSLNGIGREAFGTLAASTSTDFGNVEVGASAQRSFLFTNTGGRTLTGVYATASGTGFALGANTCGTQAAPIALALGASCSYSVSYSASAVGSASGQTRVVSSAVNSPSSLSLSASTAATYLAQLSTTTLGFGDRDVGTSPTLSVNLLNVGNSPLTLQTPLLQGDASFTAQTACGATLAAGASCATTVTFSPTSAGDKSASLELAGNFTNTLSAVTVTGRGQTNTGALAAASGSSAAFGTLEVGQSATRNFEFTASGTKALTGVYAAVSGTGLTLSSNTCGTQASPVTLASGAKCTYSVVYAPTAEGTLSGSTSVTSSATNSPENLALSGTATPSTADGNWASVSALLRGNGTNGSAVFTDSKGAYTWSITGTTGATPTISTAQSKFGGASMYFPGGRGIQSNANLSMGTGDFTMEFWAYRTGDSGRPTPIIATNGWILGSNMPGFYTAGFRFSPYEWCTVTANNCGSYGRMIQTGATYNVSNTWQHVALTRQGNTYRYYVNGVKVSESVQTTSWNLDYGQADLRVTIGAGWIGYLDDLRITKGVARYVGASFSVPTAELPSY